MFNVLVTADVRNMLASDPWSRVIDKMTFVIIPITQHLVLQSTISSLKAC